MKKVDLGRRGLDPETLVPGPRRVDDDGIIAEVFSSSKEAGLRGL